MILQTLAVSAFSVAQYQGYYKLCGMDHSIPVLFLPHLETQ